jgi:TetR/AcrR family transcriptional regulator, transcriptional repressor of bet genes
MGIERSVNGGDVPGEKAAGAERQEQILAAAFEVATSRGLEGLTIRRVAAEAGLSHGLVHFHFTSKAELLIALLDWLLSTTGAFVMRPEIASMASPLQRLLALLKQEMERITRDRARIHLFFDFWLMGTRHPRIRRRMSAELTRYRQAFRPMAEEVLRAEPERFPNVTPEALCAVVVAFIKGSALQSVIDPGGLDVPQFTAAAQGLLSQMAPDDVA